MTTKCPQKQQQSESLQNRSLKQPPRTASTNMPSLFDSENLGLQKAVVTRELVQKLASSNRRKEETEVDSRAESWGAENPGFLVFVDSRPFLPPRLCLDHNKVLVRRLIPNTQQNLHNVTLVPSVTGYKKFSLPGPKLPGGSLPLS